MRGGREGNEQGLPPTTHITEGGVMLRTKCSWYLGMYILQVDNPSVGCTLWYTRMYMYVCICV